MDLVNAQQARRALDYLVGFNLSPLLWKKIRRGLSAGRVQSPALRLIVERELEIEKFKTQEYWTVHFDSEKDRLPFTARLSHFQGEKLDQFAVGSAARNEEVTRFLETHGKGTAKVKEIEKKRKLRSPAPPFTTSTLQQEPVKLYEMTGNGGIGSQMTPAKFDTVAVDFTVGGPGNVFRATGQTMVFPGFFAVYHEDQDDAVEEEDRRLPSFETGDAVKIQKLYGEQHFTQPPPRYSEASLVKALEQYGIGRPSTYASIISTLQNREYVVLDKKRFTPTDVGRVVNKFLTEHFAHWVDYEYTARLEDELDDISNGKEEWVPMLQKFWKDFSAQIDEKESVSRKDVTQEQMDETCPKCGKHPLTIRLGRRGRLVDPGEEPRRDRTSNMEGNGGAEGGHRKIGTEPKKPHVTPLLQG